MKKNVNLKFFNIHIYSLHHYRTYTQFLKNNALIPYSKFLLLDRLTLLAFLVMYMFGFDILLFYTRDKDAVRIKNILFLLKI